MQHIQYSLEVLFVIQLRKPGVLQIFSSAESIFWAFRILTGQFKREMG